MKEANSPTVQRLLERDVDDERDRHRGERVRHRGGERCGNRLAHGVAPQLLVGAREAARLVVLATEDLHHLVALDGLLEHVHHVADRVLHRARHGAQPPR
jgi:hypothetical protein